jgi:hypothetical protein
MRGTGGGIGVPKRWPNWPGVSVSLTTSFNRTLAFRPEMKGPVEVVTRDRSLLGRMVDRLRSAMDR